MKEENFVQTLTTIADKHNLAINERQIPLFYVYYRELFRWNKSINLISQNDEKGFISRHIIDSLSLLLKVDFTRDDTLLDLGSGNGLPGIPLAIMLAGTSITLLESSIKKCVFLQHIKSRLQLENVSVLHGRFESLCEQLTGFNYVLVRGKKLSYKEKRMIMSCLTRQGSLIIYAGRKTHNMEEKNPNEKIEISKSTGGRKIIIIRQLC